MSCRQAIYIIGIAIVMLFGPKAIVAENIDPHDNGRQYAWGENIGWLNFEPQQGPGVHVSSAKVEGFVWAENIGWINLSPASYGGLVNDGQGNLSGHAWGENVGWINFDPQAPDETDYGVKIDADGNFDGWAWAENIGWIRFDSTKAYNVQACKVTLSDLVNFAAYWLDTASSPADLDGQDGANNRDFAQFAQYWLDFCPDGWQLK